MSDDISNWIDSIEKFIAPSENQNRTMFNALNFQPTVGKKEGTIVPGQASQYSLFGPGYMPTTSTIQTLPSGCYDINASDQGAFVVPTPKPVGLLLELPEMKSDAVIHIIEKFWNSEKDYKEGNEYVIGGAAYKAGIILYGPPGTGKSCTIKILTNKMIERGGIVFNASSHPGTVMDILGSFSIIENNRKSIVILEDIDSMIAKWGESQYLELLDSAKTINNVLFIATTNYPEKLDPRIYNRPGRFSHVVKIGYPGKAARKAYLQAILKKYDDVDYMVDNSEGFSIDHLTALVNAVYREKKNLKEEMLRLRTLFRIPKIDDNPLGFSLGSDSKDFL